MVDFNILVMSNLLLFAQIQNHSIQSKVHKSQAFCIWPNQLTPYGYKIITFFPLLHKISITETASAQKIQNNSSNKVIF